MRVKQSENTKRNTTSILAKPKIGGKKEKKKSARRKDIMYCILNGLLLKSQSSMFTSKSLSKNSLVLYEFLSTQTFNQLPCTLTR